MHSLWFLKTFEYIRTIYTRQLPYREKIPITLNMLLSKLLLLALLGVVIETRPENRDAKGTNDVLEERAAETVGSVSYAHILPAPR